MFSCVGDDGRSLLPPECRAQKRSGLLWGRNLKCKEECQHEYEVNCFLCLPQHLDARIGWLETGTCLSPNCFLGQDEAKEELSDALESQ
ncbi:unnamed protein product [Bubo scandiacus]